MHIFLQFQCIHPLIIGAHYTMLYFTYWPWSNLPPILFIKSTMQEKTEGKEVIGVSLEHVPTIGDIFKIQNIFMINGLIV